MTLADPSMLEKLSKCSCSDSMVGFFYCEKQPKCNGQVYYCEECGEKYHDHRPVQRAKITRTIANEWRDKVTELYDKLDQMIQNLQQESVSKLIEEL